MTLESGLRSLEKTGLQSFECANSKHLDFSLRNRPSFSLDRMKTEKNASRLFLKFLKKNQSHNLVNYISARIQSREIGRLAIGALAVWRVAAWHSQ
jgi:hypothetical protein